MEVDELSKAIRMVKNKMGMVSMSAGMGEGVGDYDDPQMVFWQKLVSYLENVLSIKKRAGSKGRDKKYGRTAKPESRKQSKNEPKRK